MKARFNDGLTSASHIVDVEVEDGALAFAAGGADHCWPLVDLRIEKIGDRARLSLGDARLLVDAKAWRLATGAAGAAVETRHRSLERKLVIALTAGGIAVAALLFVGIPAVSPVLAQMTPPQFEQQLGENFNAQLALAFPSCEGTSGQAALADLGRRLSAQAQTNFPIQVRAVEAPMVNAFALPGGLVVVTDDLIEMARSPDELAAVVAHETAHVEKRHVMQSVWRSMGLGLVLDLVIGGGTGAGQQAVLLAANFADLRFSRAAEVEADRRGMQLLEGAGLSSQGMAPFFERLATKNEGPSAAAVKELISSHPDTRGRARTSRALARAGAPALSPAAWAEVRDACASNPRGERFRRWRLSR